MLRKTLTILSLLGLLLSVGLWGVSHLGYVDAVILDDYELLVWSGDCRIRAKPPRPSWMPQSMADATKPPTLLEEHIEKVGLLSLGSGVTVTIPFSSGGTTHSVPLWIPSVAFLMLTILCVVPSAHRRRKRRKLGLCVKCGYNLKGLPEPRCPECNTSFEERLLKKDA